MRRLDITDEERKGCTVTFNEERKGCTVTFNENRYEIYSKTGVLFGTVQGKLGLKAFCRVNKLIDPLLDDIATRTYKTGL